jgi:hypothetical protein
MAAFDSYRHRIMALVERPSSSGTDVYLREVTTFGPWCPGIYHGVLFIGFNARDVTPRQ